MSGYGYGYGAPPGGQPHGYGAPPAGQPHGYGAPPTSQPHGHSAPPGSQPYGHSAPPSSQPYGHGAPPGGQSYGHSGVATAYPASGGYGNPMAMLVPSTFPPGTDPSIVACFEMVDVDRSGQIDDKELQKALSSYNQSFSLRTVHLLMNMFTNSNVKKIGPKEFTALFQGLQNWRRFDRDRSGRIDSNELREALLSLGYSLSPMLLELLISKYDKTDGRNKAIEYDNFIECCLTVKGLTDKFKEKDTNLIGNATFSYESFMLTVLPFIVA
ncbi:putative calcium-binding protein cml49 [Stylosanthes scabra]|uniref:Calcium-binding protein cml49 n=2 Tax=Stylosanthes scabra TaxID=79078 RepID=A0ABU6TJV9_9FABA|nr:putative calcium-binding protein cml49 [Stylosanthes scabra]